MHRTGKFPKCESRHLPVTADKSSLDIETKLVIFVISHGGAHDKSEASQYIDTQKRRSAMKPTREKSTRTSRAKKPALKTRHHGDYHLGQVLVSNNDFLIIDFEGEPSRPLAESRKKHSPLRDVAGMLRSFSYARGSTQLRERTEPGIERLGPALAAWEKATRKAFVEAYAAATKGSGLFDSIDDMRGLLQLAEMEKVLYELRYEAANRPDWIHIPVQGLMSLLAGG